MRANATSLHTRIKRMREQIAPPKPKETRLPYVVLDFDTGGDLPGYEEHNIEHRRLARRLRVPAKAYGFDPILEEGSED